MKRYSDSIKSMLNQKRVEILEHVLETSKGGFWEFTSEEIRDAMLKNWNDWRAKVRKKARRGEMLYENALIDAVTIGQISGTGIYIIPKIGLNEQEKILLKLHDNLFKNQRIA